MPPFEQLIDEHGALVLRVCRAVLGADDAEDAWSETFLAALTAYPRLRADSNVRGWLVTIAHNKSVDLLRKRSRTPLPTDDLPEAVGSDPMPPRDDELWAALEQLPFKQRSAIAYHHLAGMPYAEVGRLVGSSEAAARRSAADGLARLRAIYPPETPTRGTEP